MAKTRYGECDGDECAQYFPNCHTKVTSYKRKKVLISGVGEWRYFFVVSSEFSELAKGNFLDVS